MTHTAHTETDDATGLTLFILADECSGDSDPLQWDDAVRLVILQRNHINPGEAYGLETAEQAEAFAAENAAPGSAWEVFPLFAYSHGDTIYRPSEGGNPFSCQWDSGRVGIVALRRADFGDARDAGRGQRDGQQQAAGDACGHGPGHARRRAAPLHGAGHCDGDGDPAGQ